MSATHSDLVRPVRGGGLCCRGRWATVAGVDTTGRGWAEVLAAFERHLHSERGRSEHTTRAYLGDVRSLVSFLHETGVADLADVRLQDLRAWLAQQAQAGAARSTIARRSAAVRTFLA